MKYESPSKKLSDLAELEDFVINSSRIAELSMWDGRSFEGTSKSMPIHL